MGLGRLACVERAAPHLVMVGKVQSLFVPADSVDRGHVSRLVWSAPGDGTRRRGRNGCCGWARIYCRLVVLRFINITETAALVKQTTAAFTVLSFLAMLEISPSLDFC